MTIRDLSDQLDHSFYRKIEARLVVHFSMARRGYDNDYPPRRGGRRGGRGRDRQGMHEPVPEYENPDFVPNWDEKIDDFDQMDLNQELLHGIYSYGFKNPSEIQSLAIKPICDKRSVIAQAQSGTGKTGAFAIGILNNIELELRVTQAVVLAPTRELADQIYHFFVDISGRMPGLTIRLFIGGGSVDRDRSAAAESPHIVIATPGRALDLMESQHLRCDDARMLCIDEADQMLQGVFVEQLQGIFPFLPQDTQVLLFSATIPMPVFKIMSDFMHDPVKILVKAEQLTLEGIRQFYVNVMEERHKFETLLDIYGQLSIQKAVIFANSKRTVDLLADSFRQHGFAVSPIHAGLTQAERDQVMRKFRIGETRVLIATDLLGRGIDVQQITLVINYELPNSVEQYLHRIGRSGRYGRKGVAINICAAEEMRGIDLLRRHYQTDVAELPANIKDILEEANESVDKRDGQ